MDLRLLKRLVFDSIKYSSLDASRKDDCRNLLQNQWDIFTQLIAFQREELLPAKVELSIVEK